MKFGKYLEEKARAEWADKYLAYKALKDLIKRSAEEHANAGTLSFSPRTTSLTVQRAADKRDSAEEKFFARLEAEVEKIGGFTGQLVADLRARLQALQAQVAEAGEEEKDGLLEGRCRVAAVPSVAAASRRARPLCAQRRITHVWGGTAQEAKNIGDEFLQLEKYVNLNYMGFHKILKKHDKMLPHSPCRQFYISHLHNQPWGNYADLLLILSNVYAALRGDQPTGPSPADEAVGAGASRSATKYWVRMSDVSAVKHHILQHLPVFQQERHDGSGGGDTQAVNSVYLDNSSLELYHGRLDKRPGAMAVRLRWYGPDPDMVHVERKTHRETWKGEESVKERFTLPASSVVAFLEGELPPGVGLAELQAKARAGRGGAGQGGGKTEEEQRRYADLFAEVQRTVDAKQLQPMVRTQYMRTVLQIPFDDSVRVSLATNVAMIRENPEDAPSCLGAGRWYRDPSLPIHRTEITRFPHAVLEIKLALPDGEQAPPEWVTELVDSGLLTEVHKFSKFIHGTATLFPDMVQAVPYWVDDESVRASMLMSAPDQPAELAPTARDQPAAGRSKPRRRIGEEGEEGDELRQPLLGGLGRLGGRAGEAGARMSSMLSTVVHRMREQAGEQSGLWATFTEWWFAKPPMRPRPLLPGQPIPQRAEPKTYMANERTFLAWLHMAVTLGSISAALLGFARSVNPKKELPGSNHMIAFISMVLLPVAVLMCGYALMVFVWRSGEIRDKALSYIDDRRGPLALTAVIVTALSMIWLVAFVDLVAAIHHSGGAGPPSPPPAQADPTSLLTALFRTGGSTGGGRLAG
eukprot:scaffold2.g7158.t1